MSLYNLTPEIVSFVSTFLHVSGGISTCTSSCAVYFMLFQTPKTNAVYARHLMHVQAWIIALDLVLCLLIVPVPLFPIIGTVWFGVVRTIDPHYLVVMAMLAVGNMQAAIALCFHYRYEAVMNASGGGKSNFKRRSGIFAFRAYQMAMHSSPAIAFSFFHPGNVQESKQIIKDHAGLAWLVTQNCDYFVYSMNGANAEIYYRIRPVLAVAAISSFTSISSLAALTFRGLRTQVMSEKTRAIQRKLTKRLIIQAVLPLSLMAFPVFIYLGAVVFDMFSNRTCALFVCIQSLHSIVHSLLLIFLCDAYRKVIIRKD